MCSKWTCFLGIAIGIICCVSETRHLSAKELPSNQEKWLFLLEQIRSHSEQLKSGECTITGRMYSPEISGKTILIDHKFEIRLAFVRPLKCRWEGHVPSWIHDPAQAGVDANGQPTTGFKFDEKNVLFTSNGPNAAYWDSDQLKTWISLWPRSTAETHLHRILYFPDIAYLPLYTSFERGARNGPDQIINVLKKQQNVSVDDSGSVWKVQWTRPVKEQKIDVVTVMEVDAENGFTVTKFAFLVRRPNGKETVQEQLTAKWENQNGAYVPTHYTTQIGTIQSGSYTTTEADVTWSSVNVPLADSLFEWQSLKVPPGTGVLDERQHPPVFIKMASNPAFDFSPEPVHSWKWWVIGSIALAFVVLVIWLFRRHVRRTALT